MRKNTLIPVVVCLMVSLLSGQDPVTSSSNFKDLPPVPRAIIEPPLPGVKTSPKDLRRKTRVIKKENHVKEEI